ncbi:MAG: efflux RND transporter permease subunit, partial [Desulfobacterales bacterium]|nr:efflux RND transporter permease subunit [Desulfobacterales bacterium]
AHVIYRNRIKTIVIMLVLTAAMVSQIPKITIDTSTEGFLHTDDPALVAYNNFRDQFGRDEVIIIAIKSADIFSPKFLETIQKLHEELEENVPYIDDITSLVNARNTRGEADELIVEDLLEHWPQNQGEMTALKKRVLTNPLYKNLLISEDATFTTIIIKTQSHSSLGQDVDVLEGFEEEAAQDRNVKSKAADQGAYLTDEENSRAVNAARGVIEKYRAPDFDIFLTGSPVVTHFLKRSMINDMRKFVALAVATVAILLFVMFRRVSGVLLPLVIVILSLLATIGIMALAGVAVKVPTQILPSFLLAVGVGTSVHILAIFFQRLQKTNDKEEAIAYALGHSGLAVVMTNVTTACGLMSFATAEVAPVADLGLFAGIGVLLTFINTLVLLPAVLALVPVSAKRLNGRPSKSSVMDRFLSGIGHFSTTHPVPILIVSSLIVGLSIFAALQIRFSHDVLKWFPEKNEIRRATEKIDHELRGTLNLEVIIDAGNENELYNPALLKRIDKAAADTESLEFEEVFVGKAWSLATILKEINQALNENRSDYYRIPSNRDLIAQEFLLFENSGSDDLEDVVDSQFSKARFTIKGPFKDAVKYNRLIDTVNRYFDENFPGETITLTGLMVLMSRTVNNAIISMTRSYVIALVVITVLMIILIGRFRIGLLSMIPNLAPILIMLGIIGATPFKMDLFTMMVASIAIGLAVDDTIHFMHNFRRYYEQSGDPKQAVYETLHTTGRAMLVTSIVLSIGFFIFVFASMNNLFAFGLLTAITILMALAADYLVAPALMVLVNRPHT